MDLAGMFTLLLVASGAILLADWALFKRRRLRGGEGTIVGEPLLVQYARSFFPVILIVLLIRAFVVEPFRIPSASMMPGLVAGDFIFVDKFAYGLRLPLINTKIVPIGAIFVLIDRKSTPLNSSHQIISYAAFCFQKK